MVYPMLRRFQRQHKKNKFLKLGNIVIFQLEHSIMLKINPIKVSRKVNCSADPFKIPVSCENTTSFSASRSLQAAINRSGTLQAEH